MTLIADARKSAKQVVQSLPHGSRIVSLYKRVRAAREDRRYCAVATREARTFLESGRLFLGAHEAILNDFRSICLATQVSFPAICNLEAVARGIVSHGPVGAFVECGTWRGGALAYWARSYLRNGGVPENSAIFGFDSFEGMPEMTLHDGEPVARWLHGKRLQDVPQELVAGRLVSAGFNVASEAQCWASVIASGFPTSRISIVKGWFQHTLATHAAKIGPIAVLRLDADFYESTRICLATLFDQVVTGGAVIIDDYGAFPGCRRAVDEFLAPRGLTSRLVYVDETVRFFYKP
jgi:hypothetical protein